jgi:hypothetical protein
LPIKTVAVTPPRRRNVRAVPELRPAEDDAELINVGPVMVRAARRATPAPHHHFHIGERLRLTAGGSTVARAGAVCKVLALLPYEGHGSLLYRVRSDAEQFERIVAEADLSRG